MDLFPETSDDRRSTYVVRIDMFYLQCGNAELVREDAALLSGGVVTGARVFLSCYCSSSL